MGCLCNICSCLPCGGAPNDTNEATNSISLNSNNDDVTVNLRGPAPTWAVAPSIWVRDRTAVLDVQVNDANLQGNAVRLDANANVQNADISVHSPGIHGPTAESEIILNGGAAVRLQAVPDIPNEIQTNANVVVLLVDMSTGLDERYGGHSVLDGQRAILQLAMANNVRILEVIMEHAHGGVPTVTDARLAALIYNYARLRVFKKPGAGGAASRACVRCNHIHRAPDHRITAAAQRAPVQTLVQYLHNRHVTDVVVLGFHANNCVGTTVFGTIRRMPATTPNPYPPPINCHVFEYEKGLLDYGYHVLTNRNLLGSDGAPLGTAYTT